MMDAVRLKGLKFFAFHGCSETEAENGQQFEVDVELAGDLRPAGVSDDVEKTYDFDTIYEIVKETVMGTRYNLIEALAEEISLRLLGRFPATQVTLKIRKPYPPMAGIMDGVEVEIVRTRQADEGVRE